MEFAYNALQHGVKGNGSTDDSSALQLLLNNVGAGSGGIVYLPPTGHYYKIATGLQVPAGVTLMGAKSRNTRRQKPWFPSQLADHGTWLLPTDMRNPAIRMNGAGSRLEGPNLAKGDFLAKQSRSEAKTGEKSLCHADKGAPDGALSGRKVRTRGRLRSFDCTDGSNSDVRAMELR